MHNVAQCCWSCLFSGAVWNSISFGTGVCYRDVVISHSSFSLTIWGESGETRGQILFSDIRYRDLYNLLTNTLWTILYIFLGIVTWCRFFSFSSDLCWRTDNSLCTFSKIHKLKFNIFIQPPALFLRTEKGWIKIPITGAEFPGSPRSFFQLTVSDPYGRSTGEEW